MITRCIQCKKLRWKRLTWTLKDKPGRLCVMCHSELIAFAVKESSRMVVELGEKMIRDNKEQIELLLQLVEKKAADE